MPDATPFLDAEFHPAVASWFKTAFREPTPVQLAAWPAIRDKQHTLIAAPTGSGKTLSAFLAVIDDLVRRGAQGKLAEQTYVVYVSPLKALSNDIEKNLRAPLQGIDAELDRRGESAVSLSAAVRTGDTTQSARQKMLKSPPHILVTTPESLYLLATSKNGRKLLGSVETVIVDEIHAMLGDKRGSHLALTLERLAQLTVQPPVRIGLSATQKPIDRVAHFLTGVDAEAEPHPCTIVDMGHQRALDLAIEVPLSPLSAVMEAEVWGEVYDRICELIEVHQTTIVFVNTRRLSERLARQLAERLGEEGVTSHHGSMSKEKRLAAEQRLKAGELKALVATASLELGIDVGAVDLVVQIGSPKSIAAVLQRVGRSGHHVGGTSKGRLFPLTRDELVECAAILDATRRGELDAIVMPEAPIDILAQQMVAEVADGPWPQDALFNLVRRAYSYRHLAREQFDAVVRMLAEGFTLRRGRRGAYIHYDAVQGVLRPRRNARLTALTCGGAIPDTFEFDVVLEPAGVKVGTLDEDFALESMPGDIFQLGHNAWQILKVDSGKVRVADAGGQPPTIPFWLGEGPGRTAELSTAVARLRHEVVERCRFESKADDGGVIQGERALAWLSEAVGVGDVAGRQIVDYLGTAKLALGEIPTQNTIVTERFFDEAGDMHVVVHAPFGSRMNRAWGLSLRKRFCKTFNFELQAAANEDALILSLGSTHSFPVDDVYRFLSSKTVRDVLVQALLDAPMFEVRWRWNASRALAILRNRAGKRTPPQIQRMDAEDLVALVFPDQLACLENIVGQREVPDHPLVRQTIEDCLHEAMDIEAMEGLLRAQEAGELRLVAKDLREPSPMAQEIINAKPYAFLDDTPLEERRTNAIKNRRWLDPAEAAQLATLDRDAIARVRDQAWPTDVRDREEMHDALVLAGYFTDAEVAGEAEAGWSHWLNELAVAGRATRVTVYRHVLWVAVERLQQLETALACVFEMAPEITVPASVQQDDLDAAVALRELLRSRLELLGPVTTAALQASLPCDKLQIDAALLDLERQGYAFQGQFDPDVEAVQWCERRLLARIHKYTIHRLRAEIQPISVADFMRFLFMWQHVEPEAQLKGPVAVPKIAEQLQAYELPAIAWEADVLPTRINDYDPTWLDQACISGHLAWGRLNVAVGEERARRTGPIRSSPLMLSLRTDIELWQALVVTDSESTISANAGRVCEALEAHGALFVRDLERHSGLLRTQLEEALAELVAAGRVTSDSFMGVRALLTPQQLRPLHGARRRRRKKAASSLEQAGRWSLLSRPVEALDREAAVDAFARTLLQRYGVVFRKLLARERFAPPWRELVRVYRTWEARGEIRGGYFVTNVSGEQFALPEVLSQLRSIRRRPADGALIAVSAADPLNLMGILTADARVAALAGNRVLYRDGEPIAVREAGEVRYLRTCEASESWHLKTALERRPIPPGLRAYIGNRI